MRKLLARLFPNSDFRTDAEVLLEIHRDIHESWTRTVQAKPEVEPLGYFEFEGPAKFVPFERKPETSIEAVARMVS